MASGAGAGRGLLRLLTRDRLSAGHDWQFVSIAGVTWRVVRQQPGYGMASTVHVADSTRGDCSNVVATCSSSSVLAEVDTSSATSST